MAEQGIGLRSELPILMFVCLFVCFTKHIFIRFKGRDSTVPIYKIGA